MNDVVPGLSAANQLPDLQTSRRTGTPGSPAGSASRSRSPGDRSAGPGSSTFPRGCRSSSRRRRSRGRPRCRRAGTSRRSRSSPSRSSSRTRRSSRRASRRGCASRSRPSTTFPRTCSSAAYPAASTGVRYTSVFATVWPSAIEPWTHVTVAPAAVHAPSESFTNVKPDGIVWWNSTRLSLLPLWFASDVSSAT